jgi:hypothetical protein
MLGIADLTVQQTQLIFTCRRTGVIMTRGSIHTKQRSDTTTQAVNSEKGSETSNTLGRIISSSIMRRAFPRNSTYLYLP